MKSLDSAAGDGYIVNRPTWDCTSPPPGVFKSVDTYTIRARDGLSAWRLVTSHLGNLETYTWLVCRATHPKNADDERHYVCAWGSALGRATGELATLLQYLSWGNISSHRRIETLRELLPRWRDELIRRAVHGNTAADELEDVVNAVSSSVATTEHCGDTLLRHLVEGPSNAKNGAIDAIKQLLTVTLSGKQSVPTKILAFACDETRAIRTIRVST